MEKTKERIDRSMKKYTIRACRVGYIEVEAETEQEAYDQALLSAVCYDWEDEAMEQEIIETEEI